MKVDHVIVIGAGLAGSEATWQIAQQGVRVTLYEMRPIKQTPAHRSGDFAELVCSNSLRANGLSNAVGVLKQEMRMMNSLIMQAADQHAVPAGGALAVDRECFSAEITRMLRQHPLVDVRNEEVYALPTDHVTVIATGPLTSTSLSLHMKQITGEEYLYFYDAAAPIIDKDTIDMDKVYIASRYNKGEAAYLNCPLDEQQFTQFYEALVTAEQAERKTFEKEVYFEGCMPIEVMMRRGKKTALFGPMKPVGLVDPRTGKIPYAVVQLRQDNAAATLYNMVGFQTHLKWGEQKRVFRMIPGLEAAEFIRYGVMHRNTFIHSPKLLQPTYQTRQHPALFFAGQITGVEGYVESAAAGLVAGLNAARYVRQQPCLIMPRQTMIGSLAHYVTTAEGSDFQPMNINFGLCPPLEIRIRNKKEKNECIAQRALASLRAFQAENSLLHSSLV